MNSNMAFGRALLVVLDSRIETEKTIKSNPILVASYLANYHYAFKTNVTLCVVAITKTTDSHLIGAKFVRKQMLKLETTIVL